MYRAILPGSRWLQYNGNDSVSIQGDVSSIFEKRGFQDVSSEHIPRRIVRVAGA
jgi:hypothetical protein